MELEPASLWATVHKKALAGNKQGILAVLQYGTLKRPLKYLIEFVVIYDV